jgi:ATP-dependent Lon protease
MHPDAAERQPRNYLDWMIGLPWAKSTKDNLDLKKAEILDEDHYGLEKIKERILEHLAVRKLKKDLEADFVFRQPAGRGQNVSGKSIAKALAEVRPHEPGGVHDEAEIRGHRRTYVGPCPDA